NMAEVIRAVVKEAGAEPGQVISLGCDFTQCTMMPIRKDGTPLCLLEEYAGEPYAYAKLWKHHASQPEADRINDLATPEMLL
ncbi:ribulokinase, partial [Akkermansia muciniphila]